VKVRKLIIGYGNPLRGDDDVGWEAASRLAAALPSEAVHILAVHQLTPELAEAVSEADLLIFVDASDAASNIVAFVECRAFRWRHDLSFSFSLLSLRMNPGHHPSSVVPNVI
jgi:hydrogenase maturation protease